MNYRGGFLICLLWCMASPLMAESRSVDSLTKSDAPRLTVVPGDYIINALSPAGKVGVSDVFVRAVVITNDGREKLALKQVSFDLRRGEESIKSTAYGPAALAERTETFRKVLGQVSGDVGRLVFGSDTTIVLGSCADSTVLSPGEQCGILREHFRVRSRELPDCMVVTVRYAIGDQEGSVSRTVPVREYQLKNAYTFPVKGVWVAFGTHDDVYQHRLFSMEEFGFDLAALGGNGVCYSGEGTKNDDFPMYGRDVLAVADGEVTSAVNSLPENTPGTSLPLPELEALAQKIGFANAVAGNHVIIAHQEGEHSFYAHLMSGSVVVKPGQKVRQGDRIGRLGNSGNSTGPHLHYQLMDGPTLFARGLPCSFTNVFDSYPEGDPIPLIVQNAALFIAK
jgi:hypothetical protein